MYSPIVSDHFHSPRRVGPLVGATHRGTAGVPGEGPYVILWLKVESEHIVAAAYQSHGCPAAMASASMAAQLIEGKSVDAAARVTSEQIVSELGGLPEGKEHCPRLAALAIGAALETRLHLVLEA